MTKIEFDNGWNINAGSFLRMALESESPWTSKADGSIIVIKDVLPKIKEVLCEREDNGMEFFLTISELIKLYDPPYLEFEYCGEIEYGANCSKCNTYSQYHKKNSTFTCWACSNGY